MKITFTTLLILSGLFFTNVSVNAQTPEQRAKIIQKYDLVKLEELRREFQNEYDENYSKALALAKVNNWPLEMNKPNQGFAQLVGVTPQNQPLYYTTENNGVAITSRANRLQPGGSLGLNLTGQFMFAGVWDGGKLRANHLDFGNRTFSYDQSGMAAAFHPTHVAGTIISSGANSSNNAGRGVAYQAAAWYSDWNSDVPEMVSAASNGMILSNHSYGLDADQINNPYIYGAYIPRSKQIDDLMFNAPKYQVVVSAGNNRNDFNQIYNPGKGGYDLITSMATSKNAIVVAAVNNVANYTGASSVLMSSFSSYGPTDDRRIKPDIATKGVNVLSTTETTNTSYGFSSGTSMSSPGVTGTLLLVQQHYAMLNSEEEFMNAATLKGLMSHTADEAGSFEGPDARFGWGLINAEKMAQAITNAQLNTAIISELNMVQGATYTKQVMALGTEKLIATIAWTDRGGVANNSVVDLTTPVLINDLDLRITKDGVANLPWKLDELGTDPAFKGDNFVDNIEKVEVNDPTSIGVYTITVTHKGNLFGGSQNFSLIVTGIQNTLSVADQSVSNGFQVYPNPANDILNVSFQDDNQFEDALITVFDLQGRTIATRLVKQYDLSSGSIIDVSGLNSGMYIVNVTQGTKQTSTKFVKR
jgi:hypothetical protein